MLFHAPYFTSTNAKGNLIISENKAKPDLKAFVSTQSGDKIFYHEIGAAWKTKNGGYSIKLHAHSINGEMVLFPPKEKESATEA